MKFTLVLTNGDCPKSTSKCGAVANRGRVSINRNAISLPTISNGKAYPSLVESGYCCKRE